MAEQDQIDPGHLMQVHSRVRQALARNPRPEMDVVSGVQEIRIRQDAKSLPFEECCGRSYEVEAGVFGASSSCPEWGFFG